LFNKYLAYSLSMSITLPEKFITEVFDKKIRSKDTLDRYKRRFCKVNKSSMFTNDELRKAYHNLLTKKMINTDTDFEHVLMLKATRSMSGIVVISVLTKPYACPGKCLYCPTEEGVPKSYFSAEPAVMRAINCKYDPYLQVSTRLKALFAVGHITEKINIRIIGGTWSYYPKRYQTWFIKELFRACNGSAVSLRGEKPKQSFRQIATLQSNIARNDDVTLKQLQEINETAKHRIVEISIETRQDYIDKNEIIRLRMLGVTKVELGVQSLYDEVLRFNNRGTLTKTTILATQLLKDAGFKISYQMMLNLPASNIKKDIESFRQLFSDPAFCPDHLKIYPMALVKQSGAYKLLLQKEFKPYTKAQLIDLIAEIKQFVPYFCRIERVIRDIPADLIVEGGAKSSNLRQEVNLELNRRKIKCKCIRCREIRSSYNTKMPWKMFREDYESSGGKDIFLSIETLDRNHILSILRLRIPSQIFTKSKHFLAVLNKSALIREMHTYGPTVKIGDKSSVAAQHQGFGKTLIKEAERIASDEFKLNKVSVIAGVGVRPYFYKLGYRLNKTYMIKQ
jgi:elongator complex protein 3